MKKHLLLTSAFLLLGCKDKAPESRNGTNAIYVEEVRGHEYVIYDGYNKGGIVHAESCPCKQNTNNQDDNESSN